MVAACSHSRASADMGLSFQGRVGYAAAVSTLTAAMAILSPSAGALSQFALIVTGVSLSLCVVLSPERPAANPVAATALMMYFLFVAAPLWRLQEGHSIQSGALPGVDLTPALWAAALSSCGLFFGCAVERSVLTQRPSQRPGGWATQTRSTRPAVVAVFALLTAFAFGVYLRQVGGLGAYFGGRSADTAQVAGSSQYLSTSPLALSAAVTGVLCAGRSAKRWHSVALIATVIASGALFLGPGTRRFLLAAWLIPLTAYLLQRNRKLPTAVVIMGGTALFILLIVLPSIRSAGAREHAPLTELLITSMTEDVPERLLGGYDSDMATELAVQMDVRRGVSHWEYGLSTIGDLLIAPVPSALLPGKPMSSRDANLILVTGYPCLTSGEVRSCPDFSLLGSFHQEFGLIGMPLGGALLGVALTRVQIRGRLFGYSNARAAWVAIAVVFSPIVVRAGASPGLSWVVMYVVPTAIAYRLASANRTNGNPVALRQAQAPEESDGNTRAISNR